MIKKALKLDAYSEPKYKLIGLQLYKTNNYNTKYKVFSLIIKQLNFNKFLLK